MAPTHYDLSGFPGVAPQPPVLWVAPAQPADGRRLLALRLFRGAQGESGAVPGWPQGGSLPAAAHGQPDGTVLDRYRANGGAYTEVVMEECGHSPHIEKAAEFQEAFFAFLRRAGET